MNRTYRSVWNEATGTWVAASELATGRKKKASSALVLRCSAAVGLAAVSLSAAASALDGGNIGSNGTSAALSIGTGSSATSSGDISIGAGSNTYHTVASGAPERARVEVDGRR